MRKNPLGLYVPFTIKTEPNQRKEKTLSLTIACSSMCHSWQHALARLNVESLIAVTDWMGWLREAKHQALSHSLSQHELQLSRTCFSSIDILPSNMQNKISS